MNSTQSRTLTEHISMWASLVKFSHSIFALPFALSMFVYVATLPGQSVVTVQLLFILIALVAARTAAMTFNRIVDRDIDARNPRTMSREIPAGKVSLRSAWTLCCIASALFFLAAWGLGVHCLVLSPTVLGVLFLYSWAKRFTSYSHVILGLSLAMAPGGVWYALTAELAWLPVWMMLGVLFWVAGFDVLYSCQDIEFDRDNALRSIPAKLGIFGALSVARGFHLASILCLGLFGYFAGLGVFFVVGLLLFAALLMSQHRLVSAHDLSRINAAFFTRNGAASILFLVTILIDRLF